MFLAEEHTLAIGLSGYLLCFSEPEMAGVPALDDANFTSAQGSLLLPEELYL